MPSPKSYWRNPSRHASWLACNLLAIALGCASTSRAISAQEVSAPLPFPDGQVLENDGPQLLFGSQLGSWLMIDDRYDGHPMLNYRGSCPSCPQLARDAGITVVRWGVWNVFEGMTAPDGHPDPLVRRQQFDAVVDGIRNQLGAQPLMELQPGNSDPNSLFCPETWGYPNLLELDKQIVAQAGPRVLLYELGNEPELGCGYLKDPTTAGERVAQLWIQVAPALKKYSRSIGLNPMLGGPALTTTNIRPGGEDSTDLAIARSYLRTVKSVYDDPTSPLFQDPDLIPSFYSFHAYASEYVANGGARALDAVPRYAAYVDAIRSAIDEVWGPVLGPQIRIACTEWNYADADNSLTWDPVSVSEYYGSFLEMLPQHHVWLANQFLLASNGNHLDMITALGQTTPAYSAFKSARFSLVGEPCSTLSASRIRGTCRTRASGANQKRVPSLAIR
jgi:hypothetical protein